MPKTNKMDLKFIKKIKDFKASHPYITVKMPKTNKTMKKPPPYLQKKFWKTKAMKKTFQMDLKFIQKIEDTQFTGWGQLRKHLRKIFRNNNMIINIMMI